MTAASLPSAPTTGAPPFETRDIGGVTLVARRDVAAPLGEILRSTTLYDWAADQPQCRALRGRAPVYVAALPGSAVTAVIRHAWHGGLLAPITGDRFRLPTRAPIEVAHGLRLAALGIPCTQPLGYALYPAGPGLRRVDTVSELLPDAYDLGAVLAELAPDWTIDAALDGTARLLAQLALHRVVHPDLNVKNVLLTSRPDTAHVIDVDVVRFEADWTPARVMDANVARLLRSIRKWRSHFDVAITDATLQAFAERCTRA